MGLYYPITVPSSPKMPSYVQNYLNHPLKQQFQNAVLNSQPPGVFLNPSEQHMFNQVFRRIQQTKSITDHVAARALEGGASFPFKEIGLRVTLPVADIRNAQIILSELAFERLGIHITENASAKQIAAAPDLGYIPLPSLHEAHNNFCTQVASLPGFVVATV